MIIQLDEYVKKGSELWKVRVSVVLPRTYVIFDMSLGDLATHLTFICLYLVALGSYMY